LHALACAVFATLLVACPQPKQDKFVEEGGISPDPTARIDGTVLYLGPKPSCRYDGNKVTHINGRVVMLLFQYDNPPPPEGGATTALNLLFVRGDELFSAEDCLGPTEKLNLTNPAWTPLSTNAGTGGIINVIDSITNAPTRFYRIRMQ